MNETKVISLEERAKDEAKSYLEELISEGARKLLQTAIENEVAERSFGPGLPSVTNRRRAIQSRSLGHTSILPAPPQSRAVVLGTNKVD